MMTFRESLLMGSLALLTACGDAVVTAPVSSFTDQPSVAFFNTALPTDTAQRIRLRGIASAAGFVTGVEVSFDNGATWRDATLASSGFDVEWWVDATAADLSASTTILSRAASNAGGDETPAPGFTCAVVCSTASSTLRATLAGMSSGGSLYLSSGTGGAYSVDAPLAAPAGVLLVGNGSGVASTNPATVLSAAPTFPRLFSLDGTSLSLSRVWVKGGYYGVSAAAVAGTISLRECAFTGQGTAGAVVRGAGGVDLEGVTVSATSALTGGVLLTDCPFLVSGCYFLGSGTGSPGLAYDSPGASAFIGSSLFYNCGVSLQAGAGNAVIASCVFQAGTLGAYNGVSFRGTSGAPVLRHSRVQGFPGYGVEIVAGAAPTLLANIISSNQKAGVFLTGDFRYVALPNLGTYGSLTSGSNYFLANKMTDPALGGEKDFQVFVSRTSNGAGRVIPAQNNWWRAEGAANIVGTEAAAEALVFDFDDPSYSYLPDLDVANPRLTTPPTP